MIGSSLGPYRIVAKIGEGGMGEVYRASDTRLNRDVAIKVLPASFAHDPDRRARFEREAHAVAALSHPNIVAIFDTGDHQGRVYVVMELLTGSTLRERLQGGALGVRKSVDIAVQIARGLGAAHGKGIIHRDLKPENVFLLDDGQVKILDFGLARQFGGEGHDDATRTVATNPGTVMGTIGYMAPEQVRGQAVDARVDVFAFGAVLFEMVSGQRAFHGETAADTMTAILTKEPPELAATRADVPPSLDRIVRHCLEKNAAERFQNARDIAFALEALSGTGVPVPSNAVPVVRTAPPRRWLWPVITLAATAAVFAASRFMQPPAAPTAVVQFDPKSYESQWITAARFGPDGKTLIYSATRTSLVPALFVLRPGEDAAQQIATDTQLLSVSPSGELLVLTNARRAWGHRVFAGTLSRMTMTGAVRPWMDGVTEADWAQDGSTVAAIRENKGTWTVEFPVGQTLYSVSRGYLSDIRVSPDGAFVAFFEHQQLLDDRGWVKVVDRAGTVRTLDGEFWGEEGTAWSRDSKTLFYAATVEGSQIYQIHSVNVTGTPSPRPVVGAPSALVVYDFNAAGQMLAVTDELRSAIRARLPGEQEDRHLPWLDIAMNPYIAADGKHLTFTDLNASAGSDYATAWRDTSGGPVVRLGPGLTSGLSPDGRWVGAKKLSTMEALFYPTGTGEAITIKGFHLSGANKAGPMFFSDGAHALVCGFVGDAKTSRCYKTQMRAGAPLEPVTPEGIISATLTSNDGTLVVSKTDGTLWLMTIGSDVLVPAKGLTSDRAVIGRSRIPNSVFIAPSDVPLKIYRVDVLTGQRTLVKTLAIPESGGLTDVGVTEWSDDAPYAYFFSRELSQLFVVRGVK